MDGGVGGGQFSGDNPGLFEPFVDVGESDQRVVASAGGVVGDAERTEQPELRLQSRARHCRRRIDPVSTADPSQSEVLP